MFFFPEINLMFCELLSLSSVVWTDALDFFGLADLTQP
jgi:hypothetical protein